MEWRPILDGRYSVSESGDVRREMAGRGGRPGLILAKHFDRDGYVIYQLGLGIKYKKKHFKAHRLVCQAFNGPGQEGQLVNHKDGIKSNNHYSNLEWVWPWENATHSVQAGLGVRGSKAYNAKFVEQDIIDICAAYYHGTTQVELAKLYNCGVVTIQNICQGISWRHVERTVPLVPRNDKAGAILRPESVPEIFEFAKAGWTRKQIADHYGVTCGCIGGVLSRRTWKDVEIPEHLLQIDPVILKGEQVFGAKLTEDDVREMRKLRQEGWSTTKLAAHFGVRQGNVMMIIQRRTWKHVE